MNGPPKWENPPPRAGADRPLSAIHDKRTEIDLPREDWQSDGKKQRETIFGSGAAPLFAQLIISVTGLGLLLIVLLLAGVVKKITSDLIFGEPHGSQHLQPGGSTVIDGYKIKRID